MAGTVAQDSAWQVGQAGEAGKVPLMPQVSKNWLFETLAEATPTRV